MELSVALLYAGYVYAGVRHTHPFLPSALPLHPLHLSITSVTGFPPSKQHESKKPHQHAVGGKDLKYFGQWLPRGGITVVDASSEIPNAGLGAAFRRPSDIGSGLGTGR